ncbi:MAG TPA: permease prefix domain 1-containing protein [Desulfuromonadaceae bacterium]|nr:permease prefix domain 1-containing protein [Desulfuromonadaceae bacterium]
MFNLERSIAEWRQSMLAANIELQAMDELESHLREAIQKNIQAGLDTSTAFQTAAADVGVPTKIAKEFQKIPSIRPGQILAWGAWLLFIISFSLPALKAPDWNGYRCAKTILPWHIDFSGTIPEFFQCLPLIFHYTFFNIANLFLFIAPFLLHWLAADEWLLKRFSRWTMAVTVGMVAFIPASKWIYGMNDLGGWQIGFYAWQISFVLFYLAVRMHLKKFSSPGSRPQFA